MDESDLTMEEYIELQAEKAQRRDFETDFPAIVYNDAYASSQNVSSEPTVLDFGGLTDEMAKGLSGRMVMEHRDAQGQSVFTSRAWRRLLWLCHRLIACSIVGRSQALEKVTVTDLFYLRGVDIDSVSIPYLLAQYLRRFSLERKQGAMISKGQFVARLICEELDDTWAWVALGPKRQHDIIVSAPEVAGGALVVDEGALAILAPVQAPHPPPAVAQTRTMPQRMARLKEEVHGIRESLAEQLEVMDAMARDFSRFIVWTASDHNLWDVIVNGDLEEEPAPTGDQSGPSALPGLKTAKQLAAKRN
ncbi:hypothetical protein Tco_0836658 [Tanacetum coccineum]